MSVMAKKKPNRSGVQVNAFIDPEIRAQMAAFIEAHNAKDEHRASVTSTLEAALKLYLKEKGFWPPPTKK